MEYKELQIFVKELLKNKGITQYKLSKLLNINNGTINKALNSDQKYTNIISNIINYLGYSLVIEPKAYFIKEKGRE